MNLLSEKVCQKIDHALTKYPADQRQSAVMAALTAVQEDNQGFLTVPLMDAVAQYLGMPKIAVYEVASFYSMYELKPVGKHKLCVCTNISCLLRGSEEIVAHLEQKLGIKMGETTADQQFTLKSVECLAACGVAPVLHVGPSYHGHLTRESIDHLIEQLKSSEPLE